MDTTQQQQQQQQDYIPIFKEKSQEIYQGCYCEENIYKLCESFEQRIQNNELKREDHAVFAKVYVKNQLKGDPKDGHLVMWDYHVILVHKDLQQNKSYVYDFDTTLSWPTKFDEYFIKSLFKKYPTQMLQTMYRIVDSSMFVDRFASNRDHMVTKIVNNKKMYSAPPPKYPPIVNKHNETNNLFDFYLDVNKSNLNYGYNYLNELEFNQFIKNFNSSQLKQDKINP